MWISNEKFAILLYPHPKYQFETAQQNQNQQGHDQQQQNEQYQDQQHQNEQHQDQQHQNRQEQDRRIEQQQVQKQLDQNRGFIGSKFVDHYKKTKRWARYRKCRAWFIIDTYNLLYAKGWNNSFATLSKQIEKEVFILLDPK